WRHPRPRRPKVLYGDRGHGRGYANGVRGSCLCLGVHLVSLLRRLCILLLCFFLSSFGIQIQCTFTAVDSASSLVGFHTAGFHYFPSLPSSLHLSQILRPATQKARTASSKKTFNARSACILYRNSLVRHFRDELCRCLR